MALAALYCTTLPLPVLLVHSLSSLFLSLVSHTGWWWMTATGLSWPVGLMLYLSRSPRCHSSFCSCVEDTACFSLCSRINFTHQSHPRPLPPALSISCSVSISSECQYSAACGKVSWLFSSLSFLVSTRPFSKCAEILTHMFSPRLIFSFNYFHSQRCFVKVPFGSCHCPFLTLSFALSCHLTVRISFPLQQYYTPSLYYYFFT